MVERKSKPRKRPEDEEEPTGIAKVTHNPWFIFAMVILIIIVAITGLFLLSSFLSGNGA